MVYLIIAQAIIIIALLWVLWRAFSQGEELMKAERAVIFWEAQCDALNKSYIGLDHFLFNTYHDLIEYKGSSYSLKKLAGRIKHAREDNTPGKKEN